MMHAAQRHQPHYRCIRSRRTMKSQVTIAARRSGRPRGAATPHAAPQAARVHAKCRMMHLMQLRALNWAVPRVCLLSAFAVCGGFLLQWDCPVGG